MSEWFMMCIGVFLTLESSSIEIYVSSLSRDLFLIRDFLEVKC